MPTLTLDTRTDIKGTPQAKLGTFDLKTSTTAGGWKISGTVAPSTPSINKVREGEGEGEGEGEKARDAFVVFICFVLCV